MWSFKKSLGLLYQGLGVDIGRLRADPSKNWEYGFNTVPVDIGALIWYTIYGQYIDDIEYTAGRTSGPSSAFRSSGTTVLSRLNAVLVLRRRSPFW